MDFVGDLVLFPAVKEFWKSVKNWQSYRHEFGTQWKDTSKGQFLHHQTFHMP